MRVALDGEQDSSPPDVLLAISWRGGVPPVPSQLAISGVKEPFALLAVLADKEDVWRRVEVPVRGVLDPRAQKGVVAAELVVVLVDAPSAVVFDEQRPGWAARSRGELEDGVGAQQPWLG